MMKTFLLLCTFLAAGVSSLVVVPMATRRTTALSALIPQEEMSANQLEINKIREFWNEARHFSREEAKTKLQGDWLEAYNRFFSKYDEDMTKMTEIAAILQKALDPPQIQKKSKSQKKRDKWAIVQARQTARDAAAVAK